MVIERVIIEGGRVEMRGGRMAGGHLYFFFSPLKFFP